MSDTASHNKSPYILVALLSVLVVSTLVVASLYFVGPHIRTETEETAAHAVITESVITQDAIKNTKETNVTKEKDETTQIKVPNEVSTNTSDKDSVLLPKKIKPEAEQDSLVEKPQKVTEVAKDSCNVRFTGNQLLVKNTNQ